MSNGKTSSNGRGLVRADPMSAYISGVPNAQRLAEQTKAAAKRRRTRSRQAYDLPPRVIEAVKAEAAQWEIAQSDLVAWALIDWLERNAECPVDLGAERVHARSLRIKYHLDLPEGWTNER